MYKEPDPVYPPDHNNKFPLKLSVNICNANRISSKLKAAHDKNDNSDAENKQKKDA